MEILNPETLFKTQTKEQLIAIANEITDILFKNELETCWVIAMKKVYLKMTRKSLVKRIHTMQFQIVSLEIPAEQVLNSILYETR